MALFGISSKLEGERIMVKKKKKLYQTAKLTSKATSITPLHVTDNLEFGASRYRINVDTVTTCQGTVAQPQHFIIYFTSTRLVDKYLACVILSLPRSCLLRRVGCIRLLMFWCGFGGALSLLFTCWQISRTVQNQKYCFEN